MTITLNGEARDLPTPTTVSDLLRSLDRDPETPGVAVAVNLEVVPPQQWSGTALQDGDRVDVVVAVGGG